MTLRLRGRTWSSWILLACVTASGGNPIGAAEADRAIERASKKLEGLQVQIGDEPLKPFEPKTPVAPNEDARRAAMALYMKGRILQENAKFSDALDAYLAAVDKDPTAIEPYKGALPILLQRREFPRARKLTLDAATQNPEGFDLVAAMSAVFGRQNQLGDGIQLLEEALKLPNVQPRSFPDLALRRDLGLYYRLQGNYEKAAAEYKLVFDAVTDPKLDSALRDRILLDAGKQFDEFGDVFLQSKQPELALKAFDEASKHREAKPGLHSFNLATVFRQTGNPEKALTELQHYFDAQMQTRGRAAYELLKELLVELKRENELLPKLEELHKLDIHNESLRYFLADHLLDSGNLDRAAELYTNGRENVTDPRALVGMLSIYRQKGQPEKLLPVLAKSFSSVPRADDDAVLKQLAPDIRDLANRFEEEIKTLSKDDKAFGALTKYAKTLEEGDEPKLEFIQAYLLGKLASESDRTDDAVHFYKYAISMRNDPPAMLYTELSSHLIDSQNYAQAQEVLQEAVAHTSTGMQREKWRFLYLLSYAQAFQGETAEAIETIRAAQKLQPSVPEMFYQEAWIVYHARRWDEALALFEQLVSNYAGDKRMTLKCRFHISNIYVEKGDMARGEKVLEDILAEDPENVQANNDLGYLFADQGKNLDRAETMIRKALEAEPENYAYLDSLGWVLYQKGKYEEAVVALEKATEAKNGGDSTIIDHLGDCFEKLGRHEDAVKAWKKALESEEKKSNPSDKVLKSIRMKLKINPDTPAVSAEAK